MKLATFFTYSSTFAGIICDSGAASIVDCHVFVVLGPTQPISNCHSSKMRFLNLICKVSMCCLLIFRFGIVDKNKLEIENAPFDPIETFQSIRPY